MKKFRLVQLGEKWGVERQYRFIFWKYWSAIRFLGGSTDEITKMALDAGFIPTTNAHFNSPLDAIEFIHKEYGDDPSQFTIEYTNQ